MFSYCRSTSVAMLDITSGALCPPDWLYAMLCFAAQRKYGMPPAAVRRQVVLANASLTMSMTRDTRICQSASKTNRGNAGVKNAHTHTYRIDQSTDRQTLSYNSRCSTTQNEGQSNIAAVGPITAGATHRTTGQQLRKPEEQKYRTEIWSRLSCCYQLHSSCACSFKFIANNSTGLYDGSNSEDVAQIWLLFWTYLLT